MTYGVIDIIILTICGAVIIWAMWALWKFHRLGDYDSDKPEYEEEP